MSDQFYSYLNTIYPKFNNLSLVTSRKKKSKKHHYIIKDGIIQMTVKFESGGINCMLCKNPKQCNLKKCHHVYYIFLKVLNFNIHQLGLLWKDNNWNDFYYKDIKPKDYSQEECGICLEEIEEKKGYINFEKIYQCLDCGCFIHKKCLNKAKEKHCLFCFTPLI
ncbi:hypothetical protein CPAV1605_1222 [seawater metagenome]|uniref:Phorbol-ester/DAG-type domain-containing protein n=1 Tax=seawater metagenome TaxID=1561972 RepID=A0A5E8CJK5_9ZZZZ